MPLLWVIYKKITNTIKMVATSKFMQAEKKLRVVRVFGEGTRRFYKVTNISYDVRNGRSAVMTSDRGLCGGLHTKVCKKVRTDQIKNPSQGGIVCLGEKGKSLLAMNFKKEFRMVVNGLGHRGPTFKQASSISQKVFGDWDLAMLTFAIFHNFISSSVITVPMMTSELVSKTTVTDVYEQEHEDLEFYFQFSTASLIFYAMNEAFVSELANRVTAMSVASKNAGKMKKMLMLQFNRKRQEKITNEIIDIISGLKATDKKKIKTMRKLQFLWEGFDGPIEGPSKELLEHLPMDELVKQIQDNLLKPPVEDGSKKISLKPEEKIEPPRSEDVSIKKADKKEDKIETDTKVKQDTPEKLDKAKKEKDDVKEKDCIDQKRSDHEPEF